MCRATVAVLPVFGGVLVVVRVVRERVRLRCAAAVRDVRGTRLTGRCSIVTELSASPWRIRRSSCSLPPGPGQAVTGSVSATAAPLPRLQLAGSWPSGGSRVEVDVGAGLRRNGLSRPGAG